MYEIFEKNQDNQVIYEYYQKMDNYKVENHKKEGYCYLFFTSHGLYFPTTINEFQKEVVEKDKYEWGNIGNENRIKNKAAKYIFVRDIYKNWCIEGINEKINTQDALAEKLEQITKGFKIITVGSSAGGFMAILFGCLLNAEAIYAFSPQVSLQIYHKYHPIKYFEQYEKNIPYMDIKSLIKEYRGHLYFFYANECDEDVEQYEHISDLREVNFFSINGKIHGAPLYGICIREILCMTYDSLEKICKKFQGKKVSAEKMLFVTNSLHESCIYIIGRYIKKVIRLIKGVR